MTLGCDVPHTSSIHHHGHLIMQLKDTGNGVFY